MRNAIARFLVNSEKERAIALTKKHDALTNAFLLHFSVELNTQVRWGLYCVLTILQMAHALAHPLRSPKLNALAHPQRR
jgi:hypothetical protein